MMNVVTNNDSEGLATRQSRRRRYGPWLFAALAAVVSPSNSLAADGDHSRPAPITFRQALRLAHSNNEQLLLAAEQLKQRQLARDRAWAALLPSLRATGTFTHADREIVREVGGQRITFQRQDAFAGMIRAALTLIRGSSLAGLAQAYRSSAAADQQRRWTENSVEFEVARAYFAALSADNLVKAAQRAVKSAEEHLAAVRTRRIAGEALGVDQTRAQIELVSAGGDLIRAESARDTALDYLAFLIGREPPIEIVRPSLPAMTDARRSRKNQQRPDIEAARLEVAAAKSALTAAWLECLPTLSLSAMYQATQNTGFSGDPHSWNVMLNLDWVLFDGGLRRATRIERSSTLRQRRLQQRLLERSIAREVRQARRELTAARASLLTARKRLELARQSRELVLSRYNAGLGTSLDLVEADDALREAEVNHVGEQLNLALRGLDLLKAIGLDPTGAEIGTGK